MESVKLAYFPIFLYFLLASCSEALPYRYRGASKGNKQTPYQLDTLVTFRNAPQTLGFSDVSQKGHKF